MEYVLTGRQMKAVDGYTINEIGIPSLILMEHAANAVYEEIQKRYSKDTKIIAVCGSGNNGADGVAAARILKVNGYNPDILVAGDSSRFTKEMEMQISIAKNLGIKQVNKTNISEYNLIIDGLFGIGLSRNIEGDYYDIISAINNSKAQVVSVDIPSGINSENGSIMGIAVRADATVAFGAVKQGILLYPGAFYAGKTIINNAGFPMEALKHCNPKCFTIGEKDIKNMLPERKPDSNKGSYGKIFAAAGSVNMCGAAAMCGKAAYRTGAGMVKLFTPKENRVIIQTLVPEAVLCTYDMDNFSGDGLMKQLNQSTCAVCGPGIGVSDTAKKIVEAVLKSKVKTVLDADALNIISQNKNLEELYHEDVVITPHIGEFSRLTGLETGMIKSDLVKACKEYAVKHGITCVLKDARTVISLKDGSTFINTSGNSGMSTAGSGDVLAGIIISLISQGMDMGYAAVLGTYIHGMAGDEAEKAVGGYGMTAMDIVDGIINVLKKYESENAR